MFKIIKIRVGEIAQGLKKYDYEKITTEGRTDGKGTKELNKKKLVLPLKYFLFLFFIGVSLFFAAQKAAAQTPVGAFPDFIAVTTTTPNFDIVLTDNIFFTLGGFNILSGTINGNGFELNGNGNRAGFKIQSSGAEKDVLFAGDITFNNFLNSLTANFGQATLGGGLFVSGSTQNIGSGAATVTFSNSTVNFINNKSVSSGAWALGALGGGLFVGGAVSAGASNGANNNISGGTATIIFTDSNVNFTNNNATAGRYGAVAQGGGLFAGGAVSDVAGTNTYTKPSANTSDNGTTTITFKGSNINFTSNTVNADNDGTIVQGGGLFAVGAVSAGSDNTSVNTSSAGITTITFTSSTINFISNSVTSTIMGTAAQGGGLFAGGAVAGGASGASNISSSGTATITFADSNINFTNNSATSFDKETPSAVGSSGAAAQGGGLFAGGAVAGGAGSYGTNTGSYGAATITFTGSAVDFTGNSATVGRYGTAAQGGGLFAGGALAAGSDGNSSSGCANTAGSGAATITFTGSTINFTGNSTASSSFGTAAQGAGLFAGGAVSVGANYSSVNTSTGGTTTITFTDSRINFTNNSATSGATGTASQGGGLFAGGAVSAGSYYSGGTNNISSGGTTAITFADSTVNIAGNQLTSGSGNTKEQGGGIFLGGSVSAAAAGGGINTSVGGTATIDFNDSNVSISGNTAGLGGGIFAAGSLATDLGTASNGNAAMNFTGSTVNFTGNTARDSGGAIYIAGNFSSDSALAAGGTAVINFTSGTVSFTNNTASAKGGAIYMTDSAITFNTDGGEAVFRGNVANGAPNDIYMDAGSQLNINGANAIRLEGGIVTEGTGNGIAINKSGSGTMYLGGDNRVWGDFNITGGDVAMLSNAAYTGKALEFKNNGSRFDMNNGAVNTVDVAGNFASDTNLKMDIFSDGTNDLIKSGTANIAGNLDIFAGVGWYEQKEYDLIITSGMNNLYGVFTSSSISNKGLNYELIYEDGIVKLIVNGLTTTQFGDLSPLTYNQMQTAGAFKKISENARDWAPVLNEMMVRQNNGSDADISIVKDFLARTSGYFLANVIRNMAADSPNNEVYDKIRNHAQDHKTNSGLWVQVRGGLESFKKDENSLEDYNDLSLGVMFGFDRFLADKLWNGDVMWGVYGRINKDNVEQGQNKADGNKNGLGLYGGYIKDSWELKAMLLGSYDRFSTERAVMGETAKADINGVTVSADVEAAIKIWMNDNINFRPYAGIEAANTMYGGFKESGAGIYNLDTQSGNYMRTAGRIGAGLDYEKGIWIWYANVEGKYIFDGTKPEITSQFIDTGIDFYSRGAKEGHLQIGAGLGGEVRITENWKGFANAKYYAAERYENLYGNIGVRYMFGKNKSKTDNAAEARIKAEAARMAEQARLEQERIKAEEAQRIEEEAKITTEISDEDLAKQKIEAEERRKRPMLKTYSLTTNFRTNEYFLTDEFKEQVKEIAQELENYDYKRITIEGHTDSTGTIEWNKKLSRQRARSVYDEFAKAGVDGNKMTYEGFADTMPLESNKTAEGRAANRRTEIFVE